MWILQMTNWWQFLFVFIFLVRKYDLTLYANYFLRRQFAWIVKSYFFKKIKTIFKNVVCGNVLPSMQSDNDNRLLYYVGKWRLYQRHNRLVCIHGAISYFRHTSYIRVKNCISTGFFSMFLCDNIRQPSDHKDWSIYSDVSYIISVRFTVSCVRKYVFKLLNSFKFLGDNHLVALCWLCF